MNKTPETTVHPQRRRIRPRLKRTKDSILHPASILRSDVLFYTIISYLSVLVAAIAGVSQVRSFGASDYGSLALVVALLPFLHIGLGMGLPVSITRTASREPSRIPSLIATAMRHAASITLISVPLGAVISALLLRDFPRSTQIIAALALASASIGVLGDCYAQLLIATGNVRRLALLRSIPILTISLANITLALLNQLTVNRAILLIATRPVLQAALGPLHVEARAGLPEPRRPHLQFGRKALVTQYAELSTARIDQLFVLPLLGSASLASYSICVTITGLPLALTQGLVSRAFPNIVRLETTTFRLLRMNTTRIALLTAALAIPLSIIATPLIPKLYGDEFQNLEPVMGILTFATCAVAAAYAAGSSLVARGHPDLSTKAWIVGAATTGLLIVPASSRFDIAGVASVSLIAYALTVVAMIIAMHSHPRRIPIASPADDA